MKAFFIVVFLVKLLLVCLLNNSPENPTTLNIANPIYIDSILLVPIFLL